jgi:hypothetical protein
MNIVKVMLTDIVEIFRVENRLAITSQASP